MYCSSCGAEVPEGSAFCIACGARVDGPVPASPPQQSQPVYDQQAYNQQAYGQQPPYGQPPKKKSKKWLFIAGGAVLLIAIAAVLVFGVFGKGGGAWPLSGNTVQTRFVNDGVQVFSGAFSDLGNADMARFMTDPFDVDMDISVNTGTIPVDASIAMAYDQKLLGFKAEVMGQDVKAQLDGDTLYYSLYGTTGGIKFDTKADLSGAMSLKDRLTALMAGMQDQNTSQVDYLLVAEAMANSISEDCFEKGANETTLTMTAQDIIDTLKTLRDKAEKDKKLSDALDEMKLDLDELISSAEESADSANLTITIAISYKGGKPVSLELDIDDGTDYGSGNIQFGYEKTGKGTDITLAIDGNGTQVEASFNVARAGKNINFNGELNATYNDTTETFAIAGNESWSGDNVEGTVTLTDNTGTEYGIDYNGTITFGMPKESVADDSRFEVDKAGAQVQDFGDLASGGLLDSGLMY